MTNYERDNLAEVEHNMKHAYNRLHDGIKDLAKVVSSLSETTGFKHDYASHALLEIQLGQSYLSRAIAALSKAQETV